MDVIPATLELLKFNHLRTIGFLEQITGRPDYAEVLAWRPGPGRAHIAWQLMHIGITEEIFGTERLAPGTTGTHQESWSSFRGGSTPADEVPDVATIVEVLAAGRMHLLQALTAFDESSLDDVVFKRGDKEFTLLETMHLVAWHGSHHHGQAHLTFNLYKAANE